GAETICIDEVGHGTIGNRSGPIVPQAHTCHQQHSSTPHHRRMIRRDAHGAPISWRWTTAAHLSRFNTGTATQPTRTDPEWRPSAATTSIVAHPARQVLPPLLHQGTELRLVGRADCRPQLVDGAAQCLQGLLSILVEVLDLEVQLRA